MTGKCHTKDRATSKRTIFDHFYDRKHNFINAIKIDKIQTDKPKITNKTTTEEVFFKKNNFVTWNCNITEIFPI